MTPHSRPSRPPGHLPALRLTGAQVLRPGGLVQDAVTLAEGLIASGPAREVDLAGYLLLPGIVDLHGDAFERHMAPRHGVGFAHDMGFASVDADLCAHGVTTAYLAQCFSWEGGKRGADYAAALIAARRAYSSRADIRLQLRYETHFIEGADRLLEALRSGDVRYVVFNNHLPEALETWARQPEQIAAWATQSGRSAAEHMALVRAADGNAPQVPASLARLAAAFAAQGVAFGSHDDATAATRAAFDALGARICEFPTTREAAAEARRLGNPVLMGAPNVVRGGSQSGNVAAEALIADGLCDALVSDYYYPALAGAAWTLADRGVLDLAAAWGMISTQPARIMGLDDRGALAEGLRADLVIVDAATRRIEAVFAAGQVVFLAGEAARRLLARDERLGLAAE